MKRTIALLLILTLMLSGCGATTAAPTEPEVITLPTEATAAAETTASEAATEAAEAAEETTEATEPRPLENPLNGEVLDAPFTDRIFASTISNMKENLPHVNMVKADVVMEMFVNNTIVRCLALFSNIEEAEAIGSTRSTRPIFNQIAQHYSLILSHAGGSPLALEDAESRGIENFNIDSWTVAQAGTSYRDTEYKRAYENTLFGIGSGIKAYAEAQGYPMTLEKDYGFRFTDDGTPADGEDAGEITITLAYQGNIKKDTVMKYDAETQKYVYNQYDMEMHDQITDEVESFRNVIVMFAPMETMDIYYKADFNAGGNGYFACGGKIVPITWTCDGDTEPFRFFNADGTELELGRGNTYIGISNVNESANVTWTA